VERCVEEKIRGESAVLSREEERVDLLSSLGADWTLL
jgi:hypothetical protein